MSIPKQEFPHEDLSTGSQLNQLSGEIAQLSPSYLTERTSALDQSWNSQQALSMEVPPNVFVNPYVQNSPDFRMAA